MSQVLNVLLLQTRFTGINVEISSLSYFLNFIILVFSAPHLWCRGSEPPSGSVRIRLGLLRLGPHHAGAWRPGGRQTNAKYYPETWDRCQIKRFSEKNRLFHFHLFPAAVCSQSFAREILKQQRKLKSRSVSRNEWSFFLIARACQLQPGHA